MTHDSAHAAHGSESDARRLAIALALAASYMVAEAVGGLLTGSLALLADAGHMLSDSCALALSLLALRMARRPAPPHRTYGYRRTEILAALGHGVLLVGVALFILAEAYARVGQPRDVLGGPMLAVAAGGLVVNLAGLAILDAGRRHNLNVRGAWLHVLSDALGSLAAMTAGALIWLFGWTWTDTAASVAIGALVIYSSWALLRETVDVLMEAAPPHIDVEAVRRAIAELPGVRDVHDLHVWTITSGMISLSGHVVAQDGCDAGPLLQRVCDELHRRFGIDHSTIQIEPRGFQELGAVHD